ncbi:MAG: protein of unknown function DUF2829 [Podoviridae sp. ctLUJ1]|nr:MAG: protein of unknown function DUF2829 [Podoviridae sp. ctLUJ1]
MTVADKKLGYAFRTKRTHIISLTFKELIQHGIDSGAPLFNGMPWSFQFLGHPVTHENDNCFIISTPDGQLAMSPEDMLIIGEWNVLQVMSTEKFLAAFEPLEEPPERDLPFSAALELMKAGRSIARKNWNGNDMYAFMVNETTTIPCPYDQARKDFPTTVTIRPHMMLRTAQKDLSFWVPSVSDILANDWYVLPPVVALEALASK